MKKMNVKALTQVAILIALEIILSRFLSIQTPFVRVSLGFLPIAIIGMLHGPLIAGVSYAIGDVLGFMLVATGPFFPGFTISNFLTGVVFGLFLYKGRSLLRVTMAVAVITVFIRIGLTTLWLSMLWDEAFIALLPARVSAALFMAPVMVLSIRLVASERFYAIFGTKPTPAK